MDELQTAVNNANDAESALISMGNSYVAFFLHKPDYFKFLFGSQNITAHLSTDKEYEEDYPPFKLLKETYLSFLAEKKIKKSKVEQEMDLLKLWSSAHGLAAIACMSQVKMSFDWEKALEGGILLK